MPEASYCTSHATFGRFSRFLITEGWLASSTRDAGIVHSYFPSLLSEQMYGSLQQKTTAKVKQCPIIYYSQEKNIRFQFHVLKLENF